MLKDEKTKTIPIAICGMDFPCPLRNNFIVLTIWYLHAGQNGIVTKFQLNKQFSLISWLKMAYFIKTYWTISVIFDTVSVLKYFEKHSEEIVNSNETFYTRQFLEHVNWKLLVKCFTKKISLTWVYSRTCVFGLHKSNWDSKEKQNVLWQYCDMPSMIAEE